MDKQERKDDAQHRYRNAVADAWEAERQASIKRVQAVNEAEAIRNAEWKRIDEEYSS
jgi:hypothetical protein